MPECAILAGYLIGQFVVIKTTNVLRRDTLTLLRSFWLCGSACILNADLFLFCQDCPPAQEANHENQNALRQHLSDS
nr:MAG TPA: hypothetical protein [Caudoviricetes sp.]